MHIKERRIAVGMLEADVSIQETCKCLARVMSLEPHFLLFEARGTMDMNTKSNVWVQNWPSRSLDIHTIKHLRDKLKRRMRDVIQAEEEKQCTNC